MKVDSHELPDEFPEYQAAIDRLRAADVHFASLSEAYQKVNAEIREVEEHDVPVSDVIFEELKKRRLLLKDQLYAMLHAVQPHERH